MSSDPAQDAQTRSEFDRMVRASFRDRPEPVGPYMRWPLGAGFVLLGGHIFFAAVDGLAAGALLTGGHTNAVTTASLVLRVVVALILVGGLGWAAYQIRLRSREALQVALIIEVVQVIAGGISLALGSSDREFDNYFGWLWALAAVVALAVPSSRAYCTRGRSR